MDLGAVSALFDWMVLALPVAAMFAVALASRAMHGSWLSPGSFFALVWSAFSAAALMQSDHFPLHPAALWMIAAFVVAVVAGSVTGEMMGYGVTPGISAEETRDILQAIRRPVVHLVLALALASAVGLLLLLIIGLRMFGFDLTLDSLLLIGGRFSALRYGLSYSPPWQVRVFAYWMYPAALLAGVGLALARSRSQVGALVLPFVLSMLYGMLMAARSGIVMAAALGIAGFLTAKVVWNRGRFSPFNPRVLLAAVAGLALLLSVSIVSQWSRSGDLSGLNISKFMEEAQTTSFASVAVFSSWFDWTLPPDLTLGRYTFAGPFALAGFERETGIYEETVGFGETWSSNIFTVFRGLIEDFSVAGALLLCYACGLFGTLSYQFACRGALGYAIPLSLFYAFALISPLYSLFLFNSVVFAWVLPVLWSIWTRGGRSYLAVAGESVSAAASASHRSGE